MFEKYNFGAVFIQIQAVLTLYAQGESFFWSKLLNLVEAQFIWDTSRSQKSKLNYTRTSHSMFLDETLKEFLLLQFAFGTSITRNNTHHPQVHAKVD